MEQVRVEPLAFPQLVSRIEVKPTESPKTMDFIPSLPQSFSRFVGRETEISELTERLLLPETRLLTLLGMGGNGKTRLAIEVGRNLAESLSGAAWFVPLADVSDAGSIYEEIRSVLQLPRSVGSEPLEQITVYLNGRPAFIILDNFEQLVETSASLIRAMLERMPSLKCLVTSRHCLSLSIEQEYVVLPLPVPGSNNPSLSSQKSGSLSENPSVQLFIDRAKRVKFDFALTDKNELVIAEICSRLAGIPLAIELAAAWTKLLSPAQMLTQLKSLLVSRVRDLPDRHRSLETVMDASFNSLSHDQQSFFGRLSLFRGGWTLESAEAVSEDLTALELLSQLREASFLIAEEDNEEIRFRMLEPIREYAAARLHKSGDEREAVEAFQNHFMDIARQAEIALRGNEQADWLRKLDRELPNIRAVLRDLPRGKRIQTVSALQRYWIARGLLREGKRMLEESLAELESIPFTVQAKGFRSLGTLALLCGDSDAARVHLNVSLALCRAENDEEGIVKALANLASISNWKGEFAKAREELEASLIVARRLGDLRPIAIIVGNLGSFCERLRDLASARSYLNEALALSRQIGDRLLENDVLNNLACVDYAERNYEAALQHVHACLLIRKSLGDQSAAHHVLRTLSVIAAHLNKNETAITLSGATEAALNVIGIKLSILEQERYRLNIEKAKEELSIEKFDICWKEGSAMTIEQALDYSLSETETWLRDTTITKGD